MPECSIWHHGGDREEQACCKPGAPAMPSCAPRVLLCCCLALQQVIWAANQMKLHSAKSLNRPRIRFSSAGVNCIGESSYAIQEWPTRLFPHNWLAGNRPVLDWLQQIRAGGTAILRRGEEGEVHLHHRHEPVQSGRTLARRDERPDQSRRR